jgi:hypothetical protein
VEIRGASDRTPGPKNVLYIALEGEGTFGGFSFIPGDGFEVAARAEPFRIESPGAVFLTTYEP